jgi:hypothetical protein
MGLEQQQPKVDRLPEHDVTVQVAELLIVSPKNSGLVFFGIALPGFCPRITRMNAN